MLNVQVVSDQGGAYSSTRNIHTERCSNGICLWLWNGHGARNASARSGGLERHMEADELLECTGNTCKSKGGSNLMLLRTLVYWDGSGRPMKVDRGAV